MPKNSLKNVIPERDNALRWRESGTQLAYPDELPVPVVPVKGMITEPLFSIAKRQFFLKG